MLKEYNLHHMQKTECYLPFTLLLLHKAQSDQQKKRRTGNLLAETCKNHRKGTKHCPFLRLITLTGTHISEQ